MSAPVFIVGIDLGTTNSVVAYTELNISADIRPEIEIPQLVAAGTIEKRRILPSYILLSGKHEMAEHAFGLQWDENNRIGVGEFARDRGAELPHRLISSSKSWLCHTLVDRNNAILPWEGSR